LFSTVTYARQIVFAENEAALKAIDKITAIHTAVETSRQQQIPDWAYRDVLFMLIYYSIAAFELLERKLSESEKEEVFDVFYRVGVRMNLKGLPANYSDWEVMRLHHLATNLQKGEFTIDLFKQYKKQLGPFRYHLLVQGQALVVPDIVKRLLQYESLTWLAVVLPLYKIIKMLKLDWLLKSMILPRKYFAQIKALDK
jgi:hypothetical protein